MPLPAPPTRKLTKPVKPESSSRADKELLFKGVLCAIVGIIILVAPVISRSSSVQELMAGASAVGWFSLALGCALTGVYAHRRIKAARGT